ncbi:MAG TPA: carboxypeptidase-like regulatory domain-containing protein, partial [Planctomycetota bacterium]|nr:carboxypeptidase-like regulatory domain-containing protein [Planctomycetota bacterium]
TPLEFREGERITLELKLSSGNSIEGRVVDATGAPVADATLGAAAPPGRMWVPAYGFAHADASGRFRISGLWPGKHRLRLTFDGWIESAASLPALDVVLPRPAGAPPLVIVAERGALVAGRVVDAKGQGIPGASVVASSSWSGSKSAAAGKRASDQIVTSGADGGFRITGLGDGPFSVTADVEDVGSQTTRDVRAGTEDVEIVVASPTGIAGRVVDATSGEPVEGFRAYAYEDGKDPGASLWQRARVEKGFAAKDGSFRIAGLSPGRYRVVASADGYVDRATSDAVDVETAKVTPGVVVRLTRGAIVRGRVIDGANGSPVAGARVAGTLAGDASGRREAFQTETTIDGAFEAKGVEPGSIQVVASHNAFVDSDPVAVEAVAGGVREAAPIALGHGGAIEGTALLPDGSPMARGDLTASLQPAGGRGRDLWKSGTADEKGNFHVEGLRPGTWQVTVSMRAADGVWSATDKQVRATVVVEDGRTTHVEFPPPPTGGCTIRGHVTRARRPVGSASVWFWPRQKNAASGYDTSRSLSATTDDDGRFVLEHAPAGDAALMVIGGGGGESSDGPGHQQAITVPDAPAMDVEITVPVAGSVNGRVRRRSDGKPIAQAYVEARPRLGNATLSRGSATTDSEGAFDIGGLAPGRYRVSAGTFVDDDTNSSTGDVLGRVTKEIEIGEDRAST